MKILVFDTCLDKMYVTLTDGDRILSSVVVENTDNKYHSAFLISTIKSVLKENGLTPDDLNGIGTNIGPGSFTGIRACTTVARIMAQQLNIPAVGVSSLEILSKIGVGNDVAVALDARKNSAYLYMNSEVKGAVALDEVELLLKNKDYFLVTDNKLKERLGGISYQQEKFPLGDILANIVFEKLQREKYSWQDVKPLYIQPPPGVST